MTRKHDVTGRSRRKLSPFIALERYVFDCPAYRSLSLAARCALMELLSLYSGSNNGRLALSALALSHRLPVGRATAGRGLQELESKGFIEAVRPGGFNIKSGGKRATEWRLTFHRCDVTGELPSKKFTRWQVGKFHFTVSPQSNTGLTREQQPCPAQ